MRLQWVNIKHRKGAKGSALQKEDSPSVNDCMNAEALSAQREEDKTTEKQRRRGGCSLALAVINDTSFNDELSLWMRQTSIAH